MFEHEVTTQLNHGEEKAPVNESHPAWSLRVGFPGAAHPSPLRSTKPTLTPGRMSFQPWFPLCWSADC